MIAIGKYNAKVTAISFGRASTGNEQIAIQFEILDGEFAGENIAYLGTFTENSIEYTTNALRAVGWLGDDLSELPGLAADGKLTAMSVGAVYAGMMSLLLAAWSVFYRDRKMVFFWVATTFLAMAVAYGKPCWGRPLR